MNNQAFRVYNYIKEFGSITSFEAFKDLGVTRLSARIFELRSKGYLIKGIPQRTVNRYGERQRYFKYVLEED